MNSSALIYSENEFGRIDGKVANGLARHSRKYDIVGIVDSTKAGRDAGDYLDGAPNGIPIFRTVDDALRELGSVPEFFIYGIAPLAPYLDQAQRDVILAAMARGMDIVNGLPEFLSEDGEFIQKAIECDVLIHDVRKPPPRSELHNFSGSIVNVDTPVITVMGTDCAVGKRTTAVRLVEALKREGLDTVFVATGQTGLLQGAEYGVAVDVLSSGYSSGEVEHAVTEADENQHPDIIVVEGQGALSHPAFVSSAAILKGAVPDAIIVQHPPNRVDHCDYPGFPMPTLTSEIELLELFSKAKVVAITLNHEDMSDDEVAAAVIEYECLHEIPVTDVLTSGCDKLVEKLFEVFPALREKAELVCRRQE